MQLDPARLLTLIDQEGSEVWLSRLDRLCAEKREFLGGQPAPGDVSAGLGLAIESGWLHSDGLRVSLSNRGRAFLRA